MTGDARPSAAANNAACLPASHASRLTACGSGVNSACSSTDNALQSPAHLRSRSARGARLSITLTKAESCKCFVFASLSIVHIAQHASRLIPPEPETRTDRSRASDWNTARPRSEPARTTTPG